MKKVLSNLLTGLFMVLIIILPISISNNNKETRNEMISKNGLTSGITSISYNTLKKNPATTKKETVVVKEINPENNEKEEVIEENKEEEVIEENKEEEVIEENKEEEEVIEENKEEELNYDELVAVDATAYYDSRNVGHGATGDPLVEGLTVAGKVEWLRKRIEIYDSEYNLLGTYQFLDTGYGQDTGYGESCILQGRTIGTIENGTCIDIYFENSSDCWYWGRRKVYIRFLD